MSPEQRRRRCANAARATLACAATALVAAIAAAEPAAVAAVPRGEPGSRLGNSGSSTEYWDLLATLDSGHRVIARFSITNEGPGRNTAYALGHVIGPDGVAHRFQNGREEGRWTLRDDGHQLEIGSSELYLRGPERRLWIRREKMGVVLDLRFSPPALGRAQDPGIPGYFVDLLHAATPVQGTLHLLQEMPAPIAVHGVIACTHTWMDRSEPELALRRIDFFALQPDPAAPSIYLSSVSTPRGGRAQRIVVEAQGRVIVDQPRLSLDAGPPIALQRRAGYTIPSRLDFDAPGLRGSLQMSRLLLEDDPMGVIPQPFRWLMSLKSQPHRIWIESPFEVRVPGAQSASQETLRGTGVAAFNFLNPLDAEPEPGGGSEAP